MFVLTRKIGFQQRYFSINCYRNSLYILVKQVLRTPEALLFFKTFEYTLSENNCTNISSALSYRIFMFISLSPLQKQSNGLSKALVAHRENHFGQKNGPERTDDGGKSKSSGNSCRDESANLNTGTYWHLLISGIPRFQPKDNVRKTFVLTDEPYAPVTLTWLIDV